MYNIGIPLRSAGEHLSKCPRSQKKLFAGFGHMAEAKECARLNDSDRKNAVKFDIWTTTNKSTWETIQEPKLSLISAHAFHVNLHVEC